MLLGLHGPGLCMNALLIEHVPAHAVVAAGSVDYGEAGHTREGLGKDGGSRTGQCQGHLLGQDRGGS